LKFDSPMSDVRAGMLAFVFALPGVYLFLFFDLPLPWLLGAIFPLLIASRFERIKLISAKPLIHPARAILGIAIGASFTPKIIDSLDNYLISLMFMLPFLFIVVGLGKYYYQHIIGYDKATSTFCALPGGLLEMTLICESFGADMKRVLLTHATRVLLIIYGIPFLIQLTTDIDLSGHFVMPTNGNDFVLGEMLAVLVCAFAGWWLAYHFGISGASIIGPMTACAALYLTGWVTYKPPGELINLAQLILGIRLGLSFKGIARNEVMRNVIYASGLFIILLLVVLLTAYCVHLITDIPLIATFLAYIPGGQAEMNIIAIVIGVHIPYIALHHVTRMFLVIALAPALANKFTKGQVQN
jgi:uncharacterized protein